MDSRGAEVATQRSVGVEGIRDGWNGSRNERSIFNLFTFSTFSVPLKFNVFILWVFLDLPFLSFSYFPIFHVLLLYPLWMAGKETLRRGLTESPDRVGESLGRGI